MALMLNTGSNAATHSIINGVEVYGLTELQRTYVKSMDPNEVIKQRYQRKIDETEAPSAFFIAAADRRTISGTPTEYTVPRRMAVRRDGYPCPDDVTSFHPPYTTYHYHNLPEILYQTLPTRSDRAPKLWGMLPPPLLDNNGQKCYAQDIWVDKKGPFNVSLVDWETIPDRIGRNAESWEYELYQRIEPRLEFKHIFAQMISGDGGYRPGANTVLNMQCFRQRESWHMLAWRDILTTSTGNKNSTRGKTPGLIDPSLPKSAMNWVAYPPTHNFGHEPFSEKVEERYRRNTSGKQGKRGSSKALPPPQESSRKRKQTVECEISSRKCRNTLKREAEKVELNVEWFEDEGLTEESEVPQILGWELLAGVTIYPITYEAPAYSSLSREQARSFVPMFLEAFTQPKGRVRRNAFENNVGMFLRNP